MRRLGPTVVALGGLWFVPSVHAQEAEQAPIPDLDFLEYLGAWAGEDDEWLAIEEWQKDNGAGDGVGDNADEDGGKQESEDVEGE
jgi:hypothetical protein